MNYRPYRTRFRPTPNGLLHVGGAYVAAQNWLWTQRYTGDGYVLILDDDVVMHKHGENGPTMHRPIREQMQEHADNMLRDLDWLGLPPVATHWSSEFADAHREACAQLGIPERNPDIDHLLTWVDGADMYNHQAQYDPSLEVARVVDDHELGIAAFVRGADLLPLAAMYDYFARQVYGWGYRIQQYYVPLVMQFDGNAKATKSGAVQACTIAHIRDLGLDPQFVRGALLRAAGARPTIMNAVMTDEEGEWRRPPLWQTCELWEGWMPARCMKVPADLEWEINEAERARAGMPREQFTGDKSAPPYKSALVREEDLSALAATAREEELTNESVGAVLMRCTSCTNLFRPGELADGLCDWCREPTSLPPGHAATMTGKPGQYDPAGCCYNPPED